MNPMDIINKLLSGRKILTWLACIKLSLGFQIRHGGYVVFALLGPVHRDPLKLAVGHLEQR